MDCLKDKKIQEYIDGSLTSVEHAMVRDHLIICGACKKKYEHYEQMEAFLMQPEEIAPPPQIELNVMKALFPKVPSLSSVLALIAASFLLLVTGIYIYFDFANNSIIQALKLTSNDSTSWLVSGMKAISTIFAAVKAFFMAFNRFFDILLNIGFGAEIVGVTIMALFSYMCYALYKKVLKKLRKQQ
jgi:hypothetical protein